MVQTTTTKAKTTAKSASKGTPAATASSAATQTPQALMGNSYAIPAVRGIQGDREYFTLMLPLELVPKVFNIEGVDQSPEQRSQRPLDPRHAKAIMAYLYEWTIGQCDRYFMTAITATTPDEMVFLSSSGDSGQLLLSKDTKLHIADGQHRISAICSIDWYEKQKNPKAKSVVQTKLAGETIVVILYSSNGKQMEQELFRVLNNFQKRVTKSIRDLFDHSKGAPLAAKAVLKEVPAFQRLTYLKSDSISKQDGQLFTYNGLHTATLHLLKFQTSKSQAGINKLACEYWELIGEQMLDWGDVLTSVNDAATVRAERLSGHALTLEALGIAGQLLIGNSKSITPKVEASIRAMRLDQVDWSKRNSDWTQLGILVEGKIRKNNTTVNKLAQYLVERSRGQQESEQ